MTATQNTSKGRSRKAPATPTPEAKPPRARRKLRALPDPEPTPAVEEEPKAKRAAPRNMERRNELGHPDGAAAVAHGKCTACEARKGQPCTSKLGQPATLVHAARMTAWLAAGGTPAELTPEQWAAHKAARRGAAKAGQ